jgi:hypothetical protein
MLCRTHTPRPLPGEGLEYLVKKWWQCHDITNLGAGFLSALWSNAVVFRFKLTDP